MQVALTCLAGLFAAAVPAEPRLPRVGGGMCGAERQPWVQVRFEGGPWSVEFAGAVFEELQATLLQQGIDACLEGPRVPAPLALVELTETSTMVRVVIEAALGTGAKRTERKVGTETIPRDGRALAVAVAADELLRARWKEMEIWPGGRVARAEPQRGEGPLWPRDVAPSAGARTAPDDRADRRDRGPSADDPHASPAAETEIISVPRGPPPSTEIGARIAIEHYAGGQTHFGPDLAVRHILAERVALEIAAGFRAARAVDTKDGRITARAIAPSAALAYALTSDSLWSIEVEGALRAAFVTFSADAQPTAHSTSASNVALYACAGVSLRRAIAGVIEARAAAGVGIPLHGFAANDGASTATAVSSLEAHGSIGVGLAF